MSEFKIEKKALFEHGNSDGRFRQFVLTLKELKPGESFYCEGKLNGGNYRQAISIAQTLLGISLTTRAENKGYRVARVA